MMKFRDLLAALLLLPGAAYALSPQPPPPALSVESPARVRVEPGTSATWSFTITNQRDVALPMANAGGRLQTSDASLAGYTFVPLTPACGVPSVGPSRRLGFPVTWPIAPGASLQCAYRVERAATSAHDLLFALCSSEATLCPNPLAIGSLPQMRIRVEQVHPVRAGDATALVRLHVDNLSDWSIPRRDVSTLCEEFSGGQAPPRPFLVNTDIDGGCPAGDAAVCMNLGGQNYFSYGFQFGPFSPGGSSSCLVELRFHGGGAWAGAATRLHFSRLEVVREDGAVGLGSVGPYEGSVALGIVPLATGLPPSPVPAPVLVPTGRMGAWLLALAILGTVLLALRSGHGMASSATEVRRH